MLKHRQNATPSFSSGRAVLEKAIDHIVNSKWYEGKKSNIVHVRVWIQNVFSLWWNATFAYRANAHAHGSPFARANPAHRGKTGHDESRQYQTEHKLEGENFRDGMGGSVAERNYPTVCCQCMLQQRYQRTGNMITRLRRGQCSITTPRQDRQIIRERRHDCFQFAASTARWLVWRHGRHGRLISAVTVYRRLKPHDVCVDAITTGTSCFGPRDVFSPQQHRRSTTQFLIKWVFSG